MKGKTFKKNLSKHTLLISIFKDLAIISYYQLFNLMLLLFCKIFRWIFFYQHREFCGSILYITQSFNRNALSRIQNVYANINLKWYPNNNNNNEKKKNNKIHISSVKRIWITHYWNKNKQNKQNSAKARLYQPTWRI